MWVGNSYLSDAVREIFNLDVPVADRGADPEYQARLDRALALTDTQRNNLNSASVRGIFNLDQPHRFTGTSFYEERLELALALTIDQRLNINDIAVQTATGITALLTRQAERLAEKVALASVFYPRAADQSCPIKNFEP